MFAGVRTFAVAAAVVSVLCAAISGAAWAQIVPPSDQPGRERQRFEPPTAPLARPGGPIITQPGVEAPPGAKETRLVIRQVRVVGATVYTADQFAPLYADLLGRTVTLQEVYDLAGKITAKYGNDGYVLSRAIVPPQQLDPNGAVITLQVVEGYIDKVEWPPQLATYVDFFSDYAARITAERPANIRTIERYLLLAGDLPGLKFKNSIKPHPTKVGAAILVVEVTEKPVDLFSRVDNRGTKARGPLEFLAQGTSNNLLHIHDQVTVTYAGAFQTDELQFFGVNYRQVLTSEGLTAFINGSSGWGRPGTPELRLLQYRTKSNYFETGLTFPAIRARERNLNITGLWFWSSDQGVFFDMPNIPPSTLDRQRGFRFRVDTDAADPWGGINQANFAVSQGFEGLGSTPNGSDLASRANGRVDFTKVEVTLSRLQQLWGGFSFLGVAYAQKAFTPLLVSEQCGYGGRVFGRGFDPSQFIADDCAEFLGELRFDIPHELKGVSQIQLYGFADHGYLHNIAPVPGTPKIVDAASVGAGIRLGWLNSLTADLSVARIVRGQNLTGTQPVIGPAVGTVPAERFFFILTGKL